METSVTVANGIINNAPFHSTPHINQTVEQCLKSHIVHFCLVVSLLKDFISELLINILTD